MAETNYLAEINRARQQQRQRIRGAEIIDPLESQAAMDRMQGASVSPSRPTPIDTGSAPVVASVEGGGGRSTVPVHTAGFIFGRGGGGVVSSPSMVSGGCANGQCGIPQGGVITSSPMSGTVVGSPIGMPMMESAPSPPGTIVGASPAESARANADAMSRFAIENARSFPTTGALSHRVYENLNKTADWREQAEMLRKRQLEMDAMTKPLREQQVLSMQAEAAYKQSEAKVNAATAQLAREASGFDGTADADKMLHQVIDGTLNPEAYISGVMKIQSARASTDQKGNVAVAQQQLPDARYNQIRRQAYGAVAIGVVLRQQEAFDAASKAMSGVDSVGKDPTTGQPVATGGGDPNALKRASAVNDIALNGLVAGYHDSGILGKHWHSVQTALVNDVWQPLEESTRKMFRAKHFEALNAMSPDKRAAAEVTLDDRAQQYARSAYDYIEARIAKANASAGGGTPANPKGGMWSQVKQAFSTSPNAPGAAPAMQSEPKSAEPKIPERGDL